MRLMTAAVGAFLFTQGMAYAADGGAAAFPKPLADEPLAVVATLPSPYPASWVLVHDLHFNSILDGRLAIVDTASPDRPLKGTVRAAQFASSLFSPAKGEIYTAETFYSRLTQGERTDAITIWDAATLKPKGEILLPGGKRQQSVTYKNVFQLTNEGRWALVANFTPSQSVTVVDLENRAVLGEIDTSGCAHVYPTGARGFTTFCADGSLTSIELDEKGGVKSSKTLMKVHDIDNQPMFGMPAMVGRTAWFVTYKGQLRGFDLSGTVAKPVPGALSLGQADGAAPEWRPGGWQVITSDAAGLLYVLMSANGKEGSHKDGGNEVWVFDPAKKARVARIALRAPAISIEVTREAKPGLVVARGDGVIDVHELPSGAFVRTLGANAAHSPMTLTAVAP